DSLYPISRYVEGLIEAKPASRLIFAGIVGVPPDSVDEAAQEAGAGGFEIILEHPEMEGNDLLDQGAAVPTWEIIPGQPSNSDSVVPACWRCLDGTTGEELPGVTDFRDCPVVADGADLQYAVPATRIVEVARGLREQGVIS